MTDATYTNFKVLLCVSVRDILVLRLVLASVSGMHPDVGTELGLDHLNSRQLAMKAPSLLYTYCFLA